MKCIALAGEDSWNELSQCGTGIEWIRAESASQLQAVKDVDAVFILQENTAAAGLANLPAVPVFVNSVVTTLKELQAGKNTIRINGWNGFLSKSSWEICGTVDEKAKGILDALGKKYLQIADEPGFISARIIAMIINEAYYAKGESVSTPDEIDIAMKLGTNYPYGPFEWAEKIGLGQVRQLLQRLSLTDSRYTIAPALSEKIIV
jgi:3-hydroxybutyryl-CoA dehydrogenase